MDKIKLSPLEKLIAKKITQTKPKSSQPGYIKRLISNLYLHIESALDNGCDYDDIARSISETEIKIKPATLKQYFNAERRARKKIVSKTNSNSPSKVHSTSPANKEKTNSSPLSSSPLPTEQPYHNDRSVEAVSESLLDNRQVARDKLFAQK